jgi:hypothetical protein
MRAPAEMALFFTKAMVLPWLTESRILTICKAESTLLLGVQLQDKQRGRGINLAENSR